MDKPPPQKYGRKKRASRSRMRKFHGNKRPEKNDTVDEQQQEGSLVEEVVSGNVLDGGWEDVPQGEENTETPTTISASAKNLKVINVPTQVETECNIFMNTTLVKFMEKLCKCPECGDNINIVHEVATKKGLVHFFNASCLSDICDWETISPGLWSRRTLNMQDKMECLNDQNMK